MNELLEKCDTTTKKKKGSEEMETRYYTIQDIKKMEGCGKDAAYALAKTLLYEKRGNTIYVFKDSYEEYYKEKLERAKEMQKRKADNNIYALKRCN